jgi:RNA polymerase sigma factor (sigma-70 family)
LGSALGAEDPSTFIEELLETQEIRLRRYLRRRVGNVADIPDIIQEVFLRLLRVPSRETIRIPAAYIFTIARHAAQQHRLRCARTDSFVELDAALCDELPVPELDPVLEVSAEQCLAVVEEALQQMTPKVRATFLLYRKEGLSMEQISERLGITRPMAKKYLVKALAQLRERLKAME